MLPSTTNTVKLDRFTLPGNLSTGVANGGSGSAMHVSNTPGRYTILNSSIAGNIVANGNQPGLSFGSFNPSTQTNVMRVVICNSTTADAHQGGCRTCARHARLHRRSGHGRHRIEHTLRNHSRKSERQLRNQLFVEPGNTMELSDEQA